MNCIDLTGKKFGRLVVIERATNDPRGNPTWLCLCDCRSDTIVRGYKLKSGKTKSCGCLKIERATKHGHCVGDRLSRIYVLWTRMMSMDYHNLNGYRGVLVCRRWRKFMNFLKDMGDPPTPKHIIDRIHDSKNYCKSNCKWIICLKDGRKRRNNNLQTHDGRTLCLADWADELKVPYNILESRINRLGWSVEKAFTAPVRKWNKI